MSNPPRGAPPEQPFESVYIGQGRSPKGKEPERAPLNPLQPPHGAQPAGGQPAGGQPAGGQPPGAEPPPGAQQPNAEKGRGLDDAAWETVREWFKDFFEMYREGNATPSTLNKIYPSVLAQMQEVGTWLKTRLLQHGPYPVLRRIEQYGDRKPRDQWLRAQKLVATAVDLWKDSPTKLRFNRVLSWGGCGMVALFDVDFMPGCGVRQVVVKSELSAARVPFDMERNCHRWLRRSKHIVQTVKLKLDPARQDDPPASASGSKRRRDEAPDDQPRKRHKSTRRPSSSGHTQSAEESLLLLEFMRRGDLHKYLTKVAVKFNMVYKELQQEAKNGTLPMEYVSERMKETVIPDDVLWVIFDNLFKAVIGIAAPPRIRPGYMETGGDDGPLVDETPPGPGLKIEDIRRDTVHFDLDTRNVLVGDINWDHVPIHKISDLGLMKPTDVLKLNSYGRDIWLTRLHGKPKIYWLTPEQFSQEWDRIKDHPSTAPPPGVRIAGNYSWKTNLFSVGLIMWCLISRLEPPPPKYANKFNDDKGDIDDINPSKWSYGAWLVDPGHCDHIDLDLRNLVVKCMMDDPVDRPKLNDMWEVIQAKVARGLSDESKKWCESFYSECLIARPHSAEKLQQWHDEEFDFSVLFPDKSFGRPRVANPPMPAARKQQPAVAGPVGGGPLLAGQIIEKGPSIPFLQNPALQKRPSMTHLQDPSSRIPSTPALGNPEAIAPTPDKPPLVTPGVIPQLRRASGFQQSPGTGPTPATPASRAIPPTPGTPVPMMQRSKFAPSTTVQSIRLQFDHPAPIPVLSQQAGAFNVSAEAAFADQGLKALPLIDPDQGVPSVVDDNPNHDSVGRTRMEIDGFTLPRRPNSPGSSAPGSTYVPK